MHVLIISPHPDDEAIGCGGTMLKHVADGDTVHIVFLTSGERGGHGRPPQETAALREQEARQAALILGCQEPEFWQMPDGAVRATLPAQQRLVSTLARWQPAIVYAPHRQEMHPDHQAAARLVFRSVSDPTLANRPAIRLYEVWTPLQAMDVIVDISPHIKTKLAAVRAHKTQCDVLRFDEAIAGLNRYRGEMHSWPGGSYAEVFLERTP